MMNQDFRAPQGPLFFFAAWLLMIFAGIVCRGRRWDPPIRLRHLDGGNDRTVAGTGSGHRRDHRGQKEALRASGP